jgi:hypothetical protein
MNELFVKSCVSDAVLRLELPLSLAQMIALSNAVYLALAALPKQSQEEPYDPR